MKKTLFTVAALGLAAGIATSASALELKVTGAYTVDGFYFDKGAGAAPFNGADGQGLRLASNPGDDTNSDAWLQHMFNMEAEMIVNDKISMKSRIRLIDYATVWGTQDDAEVNNGRNISVERLWLVYKSPIGTWEVGRRSAGAWGLSFVDSADKADRIFWGSGKLFGDVFSGYAFFEKQTEGEAYFAETDNMDKDYYEVGVGMKDAWGKATLAYGLKLDNSANEDLYDTTTGAIASLGYETTQNRFKGVGEFKIGSSMGFDTEFDYQWGDKDYNNPLVLDQDISKFAFFADFHGTMDALTGHATYFHTSGDDNSKDDKLENYGSTGWDFEPLYILTGCFGNILNNDQGDTSVFGVAARKAGVNAYLLSADYDATKDLTLHAAIGYAQADKEPNGYDSDYGMEYNIGAAYKLLDNLIYAVHLGYLDTGDFFKLGHTYKDTNAIFLASHHLTMSF